jgi:hypothetical protein
LDPFRAMQTRLERRFGAAAGTIVRERHVVLRTEMPPQHFSSASVALPFNAPRNDQHDDEHDDARANDDLGAVCIQIHCASPFVRERAPRIDRAPNASTRFSFT